MYKEIDALIEALVNDERFIQFRQASQCLEEEKIMALLSRHQTLQEDYMRFKKYGMADEIKKDLLEVKQEMNAHPIIKAYYQSYYQFNDLLEEVTHIVFQKISDEIKIERFML